MGQLSTDLLASVRRRARIPNSQALLPDTDLIAIANEEMASYMAPYILDTREEFFVRSVDLTIGSTRRFRIPSRAVKLREVVLIDPVGNQIQLPRLRVDQQAYGVMAGFEVRQNEIIINDFAAAKANTLRLYYYARPDTLTTTVFSTTTAPGTSTGIATITSATIFIGQRYDIIAADSPYEYLMDGGILTTSLGGNSYTFTDDNGVLLDLSRVPTGAYFMPAGTTPVVQVPTELFPLFCQDVAVTCLRVIGDEQAMVDAQKELGRMQQAADDIVDDRVEGEQVKVFSADLLGGIFG